MPRITLVGQEAGGVGKSTVVRGMAEAIPDAPIIEIEASSRIIEYDHGRAKGPKRVTHFPVRADRALVERSGGQAARAEFDPVINAMMDTKLPTIIDIGANAALSLLGTFDEEMISAFAENNIELALAVVVTADASSLSAGAKLVAAAKTWAAATFVIDNRVRGNTDPAIVKRLADGATVTTLARAEFESHTMRFLQAMGLAAIPSLRASDLQAEYGFAQARRMVADLKAFRLAVMEAVRPAATWLVS
ncbi:hypothetical protein ABIF73_000846 [Bradyrhizobium japonicum]